MQPMLEAETTKKESVSHRCHGGARPPGPDIRRRAVRLQGSELLLPPVNPCMDAWLASIRRPILTQWADLDALGPRGEGRVRLSMLLRLLRANS